MTWFAASIVIAVRKVGVAPGKVWAYENVVLVEAVSVAEALRIASDQGSFEASTEDGFTLDDVPATKAFVGVRKLINVSNPYPLDQDGDRPVSGTELTYSFFELSGEDALAALAGGGPVDLRYVE